MYLAKFTSILPRDFESLIMLLADRFTISKSNGVISWPGKDKQIGQLSMSFTQIYSTVNRLLGPFWGVLVRFIEQLKQVVWTVWEFFSQIYSTTVWGFSVRFIHQ